MLPKAKKGVNSSKRLVPISVKSSSGKHFTFVSNIKLLEMKKQLFILTTALFSAFATNAQVSVSINNSDTTIVGGTSVNLTTTAVYPPFAGNYNNSVSGNFAIPDNDQVTGLTSTMLIETEADPAFLASELTALFISIQGGWIADMDIYLIAPDGSQIEICTDNGTNGTSISCTFTNNPDHPLISTWPGGSISGNIRPEQSFSNLTGPANGTWTLKVFDDSSGDLHVLTNWTLFFPLQNVVSYIWSPATGLSSSTVANPIASPMETTTYTVLIQDQNGTFASDEITITVNGFLDVEELVRPEFSIYPNPAQSQVSIDNLEVGSTITIFDVSGKIIYTASANNSIAEINVSAFVSGMYFVQVANQGIVVGTQKLQVK